MGHVSISSLSKTTLWVSTAQNFEGDMCPMSRINAVVYVVVQSNIFLRICPALYCYALVYLAIYIVCNKNV